jgi:hypothetical protein
MLWSIAILRLATTGTEGHLLDTLDTSRWAPQVASHPGDLSSLKGERMKITDVQKKVEPELLDVSDPGDDSDEQRDRNTHYLLTAWKELLESRKREGAKTARVTRS